MSMPASNPYLSRTPIKEPDHFFGRTRELRRLLDGLAAPGVQSFSVVGDRRIGKSSLLMQILGAYRRRDPGTSEHTRLFWHDFQRRCPTDPDGFRAFVLKELDRAGLKRDPASTLGDLPDIAEENDVRIAFVWDEFEVALRRAALDRVLLGELRACAAAGTVAFIIATNRDLRALCTPTEADLPFFNFFNQICLGPLDDVAARALVEQPSSAAGTPLGKHAKRIQQLGGNLPIFLQIACCACFEQVAHAPRKTPDWRTIESRFFEDARQHLEHIAGSELTREELELCQVVAAREEIPDHAQERLEELRRRGYVVTRERRDALFSKYLARVLPPRPRTTPPRPRTAPPPRQSVPAKAPAPPPTPPFNRFMQLLQECNEILLYSERAEAFPRTEQLGELAKLNTSPSGFAGVKERVLVLWMVVYESANQVRRASKKPARTVPEDLRASLVGSYPVQALVCLRNHWNHVKSVLQEGETSERYANAGEVFSRYTGGVRVPPKTEAECSTFFCALFEELCGELGRLRDALQAAQREGGL